MFRRSLFGQGWGGAYNRPWRELRRWRRLRRRMARRRPSFCCLPCCSFVLALPAAIALILAPILIKRHPGDAE